MPRKYKGSLDNIVFRPAALIDPISERTSRTAGLTEHAVARRDLERYYYALDTSSVKLDEAELELLERVVEEGDYGNLDKLKLLYTEVADAGDVDLAMRIQKMSPVELVNLIDALERIVI